MKPVPIKLLCSPWVAGFMLPAVDTDVALMKLIKHLERDEDDRGMFRPIPLADVAAYRKALDDALKMLPGAHVIDADLAVIRDDEGEARALRLVQRLSN